MDSSEHEPAISRHGGKQLAESCARLISNHDVESRGMHGQWRRGC